MRACVLAWLCVRACACTRYLYICACANADAPKSEDCSVIVQPRIGTQDAGHLGDVLETTELRDLSPKKTSPLPGCLTPDARAGDWGGGAGQELKEHEIRDNMKKSGIERLQ